MDTTLNDTIIAIATPPGSGAIGIIRLSGPEAINLADRFFYGKNLTLAEANTVHYGKIKGPDDVILDECVATIFKAPRSYTREDVVEFSCHGSEYILSNVMQLFLAHGARMAEPGEYTMRAYLNGQLDLTQAEAVADLISAKSQSQHQIAMHQLRGGFSKMIQELRSELIEFASLIELENDFGEEDVEFADRIKLKNLVTSILKKIETLRASFSYGNVVKEGVPVAIIGHPNAGKSTLLNNLLNEEKAIVSSIAGTTRDLIEDTIVIKGTSYRFIDTAGLRDTQDEIETIGIERAMEQIDKASIVLFLAEISDDFKKIVADFNKLKLPRNKKALILLTKSDLYDHTCHSYDLEESVSTLTGRTPTLLISAEKNKNIDKLKTHLDKMVKSMNVNHNEVVISSLRHYQSLTETSNSLNSVINSLENKLPSDMMALDIRHALHHLGEISGEIQTNDLLDSIFSNFCIGK
jgi:tRNA modification GTPase